MYVNIADRKINANKLLDHANDIIDNKIKNKKETEKIYLDKLNDDRELFYKLKNTNREYEWWFNVCDELKDTVFGKFKTKRDILLAEDEKLDIATGGEDIPKSETEEQRRKIKNNDTKPINNKTTNVISSKTSR